MSVQTAVIAGQQAAEARMTDTCSITTPGTRSEHPDPTTLEYTDGTPVVVYTGPCRLGRVDLPSTQQASGGDATWDTQDSVLHLPLVGSESVRPGATVTYLTSAENPALVGRVFGVVGIVDGTQITARRCRVREVVSL